jgi:hypothetical protein
VRAARRLRIALACSALAGGPADAQTPAQADDESARLPHERLRRYQNEVQFGVLRSVRRAEAVADTRTEAIVASLGVSRGVSERLELGATLPYVLASQQDVTSASGHTVRSEGRYGVADPVFRARYALASDRRGLAVTLGLIVAPDLGGRSRMFASQTDYIEPSVAFGKTLGASSQGYFRYGYAHRSGGVSDAQRFTLGGRRELGQGYGMLGSLGYSRISGSQATEAHGLWRVALGGFAAVAPRLELVSWFGLSRSGEREKRDSEGRIDESNNRELALYFTHRY